MKARRRYAGRAADKRVRKRHNHHANRQEANRALAAGEFDSEGLKRWRPLDRWEPRRRLPPPRQGGNGFTR